MPGGHVTVAGLYRILLGSLLPTTINRIIYLDADTLVIGSLKDLWETDMENYPVAAYHQPMWHLEELGVKAENYFSSGVMLFDLEMWRRGGYENSVLDIAGSYAPKLLWWDQCALNIALREKVKPLNRKYNFMCSADQLTGDVLIPTIIHFAGSKKPWDQPTKSGLGALYCEISAATPWPTKFQNPSKTKKKKNLIQKLLRK